jgi:hypothetical protein
MAAEMTRRDRAAMKTAIEQMRAESSAARQHVEHVLRTEGFASAAHTAAYHCQFRALRLKVFQAPPIHTNDAEINGRYGGRPQEVELLQRMLALGISRYHPAPLEAIREAEAKTAANPAEPMT